MSWFLAGLSMMCIGSNIELFAKDPMLRPRSQWANLIWQLISTVVGLALVFSFVYSFFIFIWWKVILGFLLAAMVGGIFGRRLRNIGIAPLISQFLMLAGLATTAIALIHRTSVNS